MDFVTLSVSNTGTYPLTQDGVHGRIPFPSVVNLSRDLWPLLRHEEHEGVLRLLHIRPLIVLLDFTLSLSTGKTE